MNKSNQNRSTYLWAIPILFISGLIIYFDTSFDTCEGLVHIIGDIFLWLLLFVLSLIFLGKQVYKITKQAAFRRLRIITCLLVAMLLIITWLWKSAWKEFIIGNSNLTASIYPDQLDMGRIDLIGGERYYATYGHIDWYCSFTGLYKSYGDTLVLSGQPFEISDGILADKYVMTDTSLIPIKTMDKRSERSKVMEILKENWDL